ncbi:MAG: phosphate signaling complex protein PhoU [Armatimonadetes bacterium]|nr:phosphate signaling complex protein PhoU [Armatimonadota bacterium]
MFTRQAFDSELKQLENKLLEMGAVVEGMVADSVEALVKRDLNLAEEVIFRDDEVDEMDIDIEHHCLRLLALQQPMASDLRIIGTAMKMITDIERVGDYSVDIAKSARKLAREPGYEPMIDVPKLAHVARKMLRESLEAFVNRDLEMVQRVCDQDDEVDALYREMRGQLLQQMTDDPAKVVTGSWLLLVAHYLERVADHATNIVERVWFMQTGKLDHLAKTHKSGSLEDQTSDGIR